MTAESTIDYDDDRQTDWIEDAWDAQIEADAKAGRLDFLVEEAKQAIADGRVIPLPEFVKRLKADLAEGDA